MSAIDVECGECGWSMTVEEDQLGESVKCPKCKMSFVAERAGAYGLEGDDSAPAAEQVFDAPPRATGGASPPKKVKKGGPASAAGRPETEAERKLRERMEKWADE